MDKQDDHHYKTKRTPMQKMFLKSISEATESFKRRIPKNISWMVP